MRALVILPTYNEAENLQVLIPAILAYGGFDILVVDDASPDGTGAVADRLADGHAGRVAVLHRPRKLGLGSAYVVGFKHALATGYDAVFEMDADLSHDPADLPRLLAALEAADVVIGSRYISEGGTRHWSLLRRAISRGGSLYARLVLGLPVHDATSGFKCFRRTALEALDLDAIRSNGYAFQVELKYRCAQRGLRIVELPIVFVERRVGRSKLSKWIVLEAAWIVWRLRSEGVISGVRRMVYSWMTAVK